MTDHIKQFKQRGIHVFSSGYIILKKVNHVQYYFVYLLPDQNPKPLLIHKDIYVDQDPKILVEKHVYLELGKWMVGEPIGSERLRLHLMTFKLPLREPKVTVSKARSPIVQ